MDFYHVMIDGKSVAGKPGLGTPKSRGGSWSNDGSDNVPIYDTNEISYRAQSTYSYLENKPIWITSKDERALNESTEYIDHWSNSNTDKLPIYRNQNKPKVKTSIVIPLRQGEEHVFGFVCLESESLFSISSNAKNILRKLADAISASLSAHEEYQRKITCTSSTLERIQTYAQKSKPTSPLTKPLLFIASSSKSDPQVMAEITQVVNKLNEIFDVKYWREDKAVGKINEHVEDVISQCRFGICYFSEPNDYNENNKKAFQDNPNVMFEAGMLQSLCNMPVAEPIAWIPIREINSPPPPFDFSHMRIIYVQRLGDNDQEINKDHFRAELEAFLMDLVNKYPSE
jgi:hypothetical protein